MVYIFTLLVQLSSVNLQRMQDVRWRALDRGICSRDVNRNVDSPCKRFIQVSIVIIRENGSVVYVAYFQLERVQ